GIYVPQDRHRDDPFVAEQADAAHADRRPASEDAHIADRRAYRLALVRIFFGGAHGNLAGSLPGRQQHVVRLGAGCNRDQPVVSVLALEFHRNFAVGADITEIRQRIATDIAVSGRKHHGQVRPALLVLRQWHYRRNRLARRKVRQQITHRSAARLRRAERQAIDLELVDPPRGGEEQHRREGRGDKNLAEDRKST